MPVWRLIPVDPDDPNSEGCASRIGRGPRNKPARETAEAAFGVATGFRPGKGMRIPPWMRPELVRAEMIDTPVYPVEGPTEVLEPSFE